MMFCQKFYDCMALVSEPKLIIADDPTVNGSHCEIENKIIESRVNQVRKFKLLLFVSQ